MLAIEAKRAEEWDKVAWCLMWIVNRMPNFGKRRRPPVRFNQLNPLIARKHGRRSGMSDDELEKALDRMADRSNR